MQAAGKNVLSDCFEMGISFKGRLFFFSFFHFY
jgi:hypothetical protein